MSHSQRIFKLTRLLKSEALAQVSRLLSFAVFSSIAF